MRKLKSLLMGTSLDTNEDIEYMIDYLLQNGVKVLYNRTLVVNNDEIQWR